MQTETSKRRNPLKTCRNWALFGALLFFCFSVFIAILSLLWAGGYIEDSVCELALEDSQIYRELDCEQEEQESEVEGEGSDFAVNVTEDTSEVTSSGLDVAAVYEQVSSGVVGIGVRTDSFSLQEQEQVIGSGFVISESGLIATNQHVVSERGAEYFVKFEGSEELVEVNEIYRDQVNDLAILRIEKTGLNSLTLGNSDNLRPGQPVIAIGNPLGDFSSTITSGIISGLNREVQIGRDSFFRTNSQEFENTIQTDAAINPGNSGGPLLDGNGNVIGINFATVQGFDNLSFALPVNLLRQRVEELREFGRFQIPYLGIEYRSRLVALDESVLVGAQVISVDPEGGAAGKLQRGDIIVNYNNQTLSDTSLFNLIQQSEIGDSVELIVLRGNERLSVEVQIVERD